MKQVQTPRDLDHVKTKMAMGLTKRQLICFGAAAVTGFPVYILLRKLMPSDLAVLGMMLTVFPFFFFAMYEKDGKPPEKIICEILRHRFLSRGIRRYRSENIYQRLEEEEKLRKEIRYLEDKKNKGRKGRAPKDGKADKGRDKASKGTKAKRKRQRENKEA